MESSAKCIKFYMINVFNLMATSKAKSEKLPLPKSNPDLKVHNLEMSIATLFPQTAK